MPENRLGLREFEATGDDKKDEIMLGTLSLIRSSSLIFMVI